MKDDSTMEREETEVTQKLCEVEGVEDFNCIDCPEFDSCQMILYDSSNESAGGSDDNDDHSETGDSHI